MRTCLRMPLKCRICEIAAPPSMSKLSMTLPVKPRSIIEATKFANMNLLVDPRSATEANNRSMTRTVKPRSTAEATKHSVSLPVRRKLARSKYNSNPNVARKWNSQTFKNLNKWHTLAREPMLRAHHTHNRLLPNLTERRQITMS